MKDANRKESWKKQKVLEKRLHGSNLTNMDRHNSHLAKVRKHRKVYSNLSMSTTQ